MIKENSLLHVSIWLSKCALCISDHYIARLSWRLKWGDICHLQLHLLLDVLNNTESILIVPRSTVQHDKEALFELLLNHPLKDPVMCTLTQFKYLVRTIIQQLCMRSFAFTWNDWHTIHCWEKTWHWPFELQHFCPEISTTVLISGWSCSYTYQTEGEQPWCCVSVGQVDESQSSYCDGGPECTVQTASSLMTHQQRRGHCVGVDKSSIGALQRNKYSRRLV